MDMRFFVPIVIMMLLLGCTNTAENGKSDANNTTNVNTTGVNMSKNTTVVFETTKGNFTAEIYEKDAPITSANFLNLVKTGFYNGLTFHRYEPGFVVQGGDPKGDGTGGSGKTIKLEINSKLNHELGSLSMARAQNPDSASSQFFIVIGEAGFLDGQYAVFGKVKSGLDIALNLRKGDKMNKVYIVQS